MLHLCGVALGNGMKKYVKPSKTGWILTLWGLCAGKSSAKPQTSLYYIDLWSV